MHASSVVVIAGNAAVASNLSFAYGNIHTNTMWLSTFLFVCMLQIAADPLYLGMRFKVCVYVCMCSITLLEQLRTVLDNECSVLMCLSHHVTNDYNKHVIALQHLHSCFHSVACSILS